MRLKTGVSDDMSRSYDWNWSGADAPYKRALELEPGNQTVLEKSAAMALTMGRHEEALRLVGRAVELDPLNTVAHWTRAYMAYYAGELDLVRLESERALELTPGFPRARWFLGLVHLARSKDHEAMKEMEQETDPDFRMQGLAMAYHAAGQTAEADAILNSFIESAGKTGAYQIAEAYAFCDMPDEAFQWLEIAYAQRDSGLGVFKGDPLMKNLENDPRYLSFMKKMGLPLD